MAGAFTPQSRLLDATKWYMLGRNHADVDPDHAVFQRFGHAVNAADVAAVEVAGQAEFGGVGLFDRLGFGIELD